MAKIKKVGYKISAKDETNVAIKSAKKRLKGLGNSAISAKAAFGALAGAMALNTLKNVVTNAVDAADAIGKFSDSIGLTTREYQGLAHAANIAGTEQSQFNSNMTAFVKRVGEAKSNTGPLITFLNKYDKTLLENIKNTRTQGQALNLIADAIKNAKTQTERAAIANAAFSRAGVKMSLFLKDGAEGLEKMKNRAEDLGVVMEDSIIRDAEKAKDALTDMSKVLSTKLTAAIIKNSDSLVVFAGAVIDFVDGVIQATAALNDFGTSIGTNLSMTINKSVSSVDLINTRIEVTKKKIIEVSRVSNSIKMFAPEQIKEAEERLKLLNAQQQKNLDIKERLLAVKTSTSDGVDAESNNLDPAAVIDDAALNEQFKLDRLNEINVQNDLINLERVTSFLATKTEIEQLSFDNRQFMIENAFQSELITSTKRKNLLGRLEKKHQDNLTKLNKKGLTDRQKFQEMSSILQVKTVLGSLIQMTQGLAQNNKTMFEINKVSGIANAIINTAQGISKALATYPPPLNIAMAGITAAAGFAQIAAIKSTSYGGGGTAPSVSGSGGGGAGAPVNTIPASQPVAQIPTTTQDTTPTQEKQVKVFNVNITGNPTGEQVVDLLELFEDKSDDNVQFNIIQEAS